MRTWLEEHSGAGTQASLIEDFKQQLRDCMEWAARVQKADKHEKRGGADTSTMFLVKKAIPYPEFVAWAKQNNLVFVRTEEDDNRRVEGEIVELDANSFRATGQHWSDEDKNAFRIRWQKFDAEYRARQAAGKVLLLYLNGNYVHTGPTETGYLSTITRYCGNDPGKILTMIAEHFGTDIISEYEFDEYFDSLEKDAT